MSNTNRKVTIIGKVHQLSETKQVTDNFSTKDIVISVFESWANGKSKTHLIQIQFSNQRIGEIDAAAVGQEVEIQAEVTGREWQGKFFTQLTGWTCKPKEDATTNQRPAMKPNESFNTNVPNEGDDLPF